MPDKSNSLATLADNIKQGIDARLKDLHTSLPGIIESFDPTTQLASIQPAIKRIFKTNEGDIDILTPTDLPILINVPVQFPRGGGFSLTFPVKKGDECLLIFCERSIDNWHKFGGVNKPGARRFHHLSDATAIVGVSSMVNKIPNYDNTNVQLKKDDGSVELTLSADGTGKFNANTEVSITAPLITLNGDTTINGILDVNGNTSIDGTLDVTGTVTAPIGEIPIVISTTVAASTGLTVAGKEMSGHTHSQGIDSAGNTQQNTGAPV